MPQVFIWWAIAYNQKSASNLMRFFDEIA